ncbi:SDR family NAD(P)-dependent oxidoreductase [Williamsia sp. M5A3_1d]
MTTQIAAQQHPLGSGFDRASTVDDVLNGVDLTGKTILITGGYSGLGFELTRAFSARGAQVIVPARRVDVAEAALRGITGVRILRMDLADLAEVREVAGILVGESCTIDVLIANAGVMATPFELVGGGWESQFAINHLGHFALVNGLWPCIARGGGRVITVSSSGHQHVGIRWGDVHFAGGYDRWLAYGQSKSANVLFAAHLATLAKSFGVQSFSLHPGGILTPLQRHMSPADQVDAGWIDESGAQIARFLVTPQQGAATTAWGATSRLLDSLSGQYLVECDVSEIATTVDMEAGRVMLRALDPAEAEKLWQYSAVLTGIDSSELV